MDCITFSAEKMETLSEVDLWKPTVTCLTLGVPSVPNRVEEPWVAFTLFKRKLLLGPDLLPLRGRRGEIGLSAALLAGLKSDRGVFC